MTESERTICGQFVGEWGKVGKCSACVAAAENSPKLRTTCTQKDQGEYVQYHALIGDTWGTVWKPHGGVNLPLEHKLIAGVSGCPNVTMNALENRRLEK